MVEFYCQSLSLYFPYILVLPQLPYLQMILCCQRQQEEQVMKLNDDMLEPTPFQSPFHLHSLREREEKRLHGHKAGYTNTHTLLSSLASRSSLVLPSSLLFFFLPFPDFWNTWLLEWKRFLEQHLEPGASDSYLPWNRLTDVMCDRAGEPWGGASDLSPFLIGGLGS